MARSTARKRALNTLYEADEKGQDILSLLDERLKVPGAPTPLPDYAVEIIRGVAEQRRVIDRLLNKCSTTWKVSRMPVVDRNILRIGAWEILYNEEIPDKVAIDEALQLAKKLSDYDAPSFIHGVLSAVSHLSAEERLGEGDSQAAASAAGPVGETETTTEAEADQVKAEATADLPSVPESAALPVDQPTVAADTVATMDTVAADTVAGTDTVSIDTVSIDAVTAAESAETAATESAEPVESAGPEPMEAVEPAVEAVDTPLAQAGQTLEKTAEETTETSAVGETGQSESETDNTQ